jgi:hypothetical protein
MARRTGGPVHHISRPLIRTEEEDLGLVVLVHEHLLDSRAISCDEEIDNGLRIPCMSVHNTFTRRKKRLLTSTYFSKHRRGLAPSDGKMVPFAPSSGMSLFLRAWVLARA